MDKLTQQLKQILSQFESGGTIQKARIIADILAGQNILPIVELFQAASNSKIQHELIHYVLMCQGVDKAKKKFLLQLLTEKLQNKYSSEKLAQGLKEPEIESDFKVSAEREKQNDISIMAIFSFIVVLLGQLINAEWYKDEVDQNKHVSTKLNWQAIVISIVGFVAFVIYIINYRCFIYPLVKSSSKVAQSV